MALREKALWASLSAVLFIWGWYFLQFIAAFRFGRFDQAAETSNFIIAVILIVIVHIISATTLTIRSGHDGESPADDREREIALLGSRAGYTVLSLLIVMMMLSSPVLLRIALEWRPALPTAIAPILLGNALLAAILIADIAATVTQLYRFRKDA